jgi:hypothetical protein
MASADVTDGQKGRAHHHRIMIPGLVGFVVLLVVSTLANSMHAGATNGPVVGPVHWYAEAGQPLLSGQSDSDVLSYNKISCGAPGFCVAIGTPELTRVPVTQVLQNGVWTSVTSLPAPDGMSDISCAASNVCEGLGFDYSTTPVRPLAFSYANGTWTAAVLTGEAADLTTLSCPTVTFCGAIGLTPSQDVVTGSLTDGTWSASDQGLQASSSFYPISCSSASYCASLSQAFEGNAGDNVLLQMVNGVVTGSPAPSGHLNGISCTAASSCYVAGISTGSTQAVYAVVNGVWTPMAQPTLSTPNLELASLSSISCVSTTSCVAVGSMTPETSPDLTLVETLTNGVWAQNPSQNIGTQFNDPGGVSCTGSYCQAVGEYVGPDGITRTMLMGEGVTDPTTQLSISMGPNPAMDGGHVDYTATVTSPGGTPTGGVTFSSGSTFLCATPPLVDGSAWCDAINAPVGNDVITASYGGDPYFNGSTTTGSLTVTPGLPPAPPPSPKGSTATVGMAATPDGSGYWLASSNGAVSARGSAQFYGSMAGQTLNSPIAHIVSTPDGKGYWLVAGDGGIFTFGDAGFFGSMGGQHLNAPVVDLAPTKDGKGYWLVASDGGVFSFGDAIFKGSMGGAHLNQPVVGISADPVTGGYWEVATDGGVFSFGAPFLGSTGNLRLNKPVNGMAVSPTGSGYWFVASDGGVFAFGDAGFHGSMGGKALNAPVVGMAGDPQTGGYWLVASDGGVFSFDSTFYGADQ